MTPTTLVGQWPWPSGWLTFRPCHKVCMWWVSYSIGFSAATAFIGCVKEADQRITSYIPNRIPITVKTCEIVTRQTRWTRVLLLYTCRQTVGWYSMHGGAFSLPPTMVPLHHHRYVPVLTTYGCERTVPRQSRILNPTNMNPELHRLAAAPFDSVKVFTAFVQSNWIPRLDHSGISTHLYPHNFSYLGR